MALALRFISGKYQGGEFPLEEDREIVVGRSSDLDMVLVEEMVSRKHARMLLRDGRLEIEDLGSTNGTFVNGEKISKTTVGRGDRILIGSNILRVVSTSSEHSAASRSSELTAASARRARRKPGESSSESRMSGELEEIPLPDLLQLFGTSKKDGVLSIDDEVSIARIVLKGGLVHYAQLTTPEGTVLPLPAEKAIYRILRWERGFFELDPPTTEVFERPLDLSAQAVLMEAFRQQDELAHLQVRLPPKHARLRLTQPLQASLGKLEPHELEVLQLSINEGNLDGTMDKSTLSDVDTAKALVKLIEHGYVSISDD